MNFDIIRKTAGEASDYAPFVVELYEKRKGRTEQVENALNRLEKDAAWLKENKFKDEIIFCSETDPYPPDYECHTITREAIKILDENGLKYVILTENAMRAISDFGQLKHPENIKLILKIASIPHKNHMDLIFNSLDVAFQEGTIIWMDLNPAIYPRLSLELMRKFYPIVNQWNVGKDSFKPKTESKSTWEKFSEDAKEFFKTLETLSPWIVGDIPIRKGNCNILVVAPHGHKADDENTGKIAWQIADILDCYAVINEFYRKPPNKKNKKGKVILYKKTGEPEHEKANKKEKWVDLNNLDQIKGQLDKKEFLGPIEEFKNEIVSRFGTAQIFIIHGITDENIKAESKTISAHSELAALIGIGRGNPNEDPPFEDRLSAYPDTAPNLMELLESNKERKIIAAEVSQGYGRGGYAGWDRRNLNQLFTDENKNDPNVQSVQIEIKMTGYRYNTQVPSTSGIFADAFEKMDNFKPIKEPSFRPALAKKCEIKEISIGEIDLSDEKFKFRIEDYGINQKKLDGLIKSIKINEILNNIIVRKSGDKEEYQLISGFRRLSALKKICEERGEDFSNAKIWAKVFTKLSDEEAYNISFAENLAREDLSIWEIANSCKAISDDLQKAGKSKSDIEKHLVELMQKGHRTVRRYLHVSTIQNEEIRKEIHSGNLDFTTAELFAKKEFDEEDRVSLHQFYKKHPMSSREFEQFTRNLLALRGWADLKIEKTLSFPRAAIFLKIDPEQLKNNVEYLNKQTGKPVNHILEHNIGFLKDSLSGIEAKFAKKPFLKKFSKRAKALEGKIGKVFDTQKVGANLSIKPVGGVEDELVKVVISAPASNIQKAIKLMDKEIGKDFAGLGGLSDQRDKKHAFTYDGMTGIAESKEFKKKLLADLSCNIGCICEFGCTFCYVPTVTIKQKYVQAVLNKGHNIDDFSLYRNKDNVLNTVKRDLIKIQPGDNREVIFCTTCDPCATEEHADITTSAIKLIMESSDLQVRVLSKSVLIMDIASELEGFRDRITYSLSTGTIRPEISACIEGNASPIEDRIKILKKLQADGFRTYGMLCPILPSEMDKLDILIDEINPKVCEHVWAEAINVRGKSLVETRKQLIECGLTEDAEAIGDVMGNKESWRNYSKELFLNLQAKMKKRELLHKFRFLQYVKHEPTEFKRFFETQEGAVCL